MQTAFTEAIAIARNRRSFIGGSDARIIMGDDAAALLRLWREKRGEAEPEDLSGNLIVQLGKVTEELNRRWFETKSGHQVVDVQRHVRHPALHWMGATLDGRWLRAAPSLRPNLCCRGRSRRKRRSKSTRHSSNITFGLSLQELRYSRLLQAEGSGLKSRCSADPLYQHLIVTAERKFWRCVESGEPPALFGVDPPKPRVEAVRIVDMTSALTSGRSLHCFPADSHGPSGV